MQGYRRVFSYLRKYAPKASVLSDLKTKDIDGFEAALEADGVTPIHQHTILAKTIIALRTIDADRPGVLSEDLRRRLEYTSTRSAGRSRPRDAYSPFAARQLRDAARIEIDRLFRRLESPFDELRRAATAVEAESSLHGCVGHLHPAVASLRAMRRRRGLPVSTLRDDLHGRHHLLGTDLPALLILLSLETGLEIECCKTLTVNCLRNPSAGTVEIAYCKRRAHGAAHSATIFGAILLRVMMALATHTGLPFDAAYGAVAWLSWLLPFAIVSAWPRFRNHPWAGHRPKLECAA